MWFKKKKPESPEITLAEITNRIRGYVLDSQISGGHEISLLIGCSPISDEVAYMEEEQSDARVSRITHLIPILYAYAHTLSEGMVESQRAGAEDSEEDFGIPSAAWATTRKVFTQIAFSALLGAISQLVDMGFLDTKKNSKKGWVRR
jgi:hypothetical protein